MPGPQILAVTSGRIEAQGGGESVTAKSGQAVWLADADPDVIVAAASSQAVFYLGARPDLAHAGRTERCSPGRRPGPVRQGAATPVNVIGSPPKETSIRDPSAADASMCAHVRAVVRRCNQTRRTESSAVVSSTRSTTARPVEPPPWSGCRARTRGRRRVGTAVPNVAGPGSARRWTRRRRYTRRTSSATTSALPVSPQ